jgi:hypothetical protein
VQTGNTYQFKSALFEKDQSNVSFDNIAAAAVQAQKVDVETQQKMKVAITLIK